MTSAGGAAVRLKVKFVIFFLLGRVFIMACSSAKASVNVTTGHKIRRWSTIGMRSRTSSLGAPMVCPLQNSYMLCKRRPASLIAFFFPNYVFKNLVIKAFLIRYCIVIS